MSGQDMRTLMEAMENLEVNTLDRVDVNLTADQWDLFTHSIDATEAADALNRAVEDNVNQGLSREEVIQEVEKIMDEYSTYGASDTEPRAVLSQLLDEIYGVEEY